MNKIFIYARSEETEETSKELPNFSIGIDLLGPDPPGIHYWVHLALIFSIFPVNFELFIHGYRLTGSKVLTQTKV